MAKYFRIIGYLCMIAFVVGAIVGFIYLISSSALLAKNGGGMVIPLLIIAFVAALLVGPAIGLLFITVADLIERPINVSKTDNNQSFNIVSKPSESVAKSNKASGKMVTKTVSINNGTITVDGDSYNIKFITEVKRVGREITFKFYSKEVVIECNDDYEANKLYNLIDNGGE